MKREQKWNSLLNQYFKEKKFYCYYELKQTETDNFAFSKIRKVQDEGLPSAEKNGLIWKLSDEDSRGKPMDGFCTPPLPAYLIIKFKNEFCFIRYRKIMDLKYEGIVSINRSKAESISDRIIKI